MVVLDPFWQARDARSLSQKTQADMWPSLVMELPSATVLASSTRAHVMFTTLEDYVQCFMETAANVGPDADPDKASVQIPLKDWHTEASLIRKATKGLMNHKTIHEYLTGKTPPRTLRDLFQRCADALKVDEREERAANLEKLERIRLKSASKDDLMQYRKEFGDLVHRLQLPDDVPVRDRFNSGCLRGDVPSTWYKLIIEKLSRQHTSWIAVWEELYERAEQATETLEMFGYTQGLKTPGHTATNPSRYRQRGGDGRHNFNNIQVHNGEASSYSDESEGNLTGEDDNIKDDSDEPIWCCTMITEAGPAKTQVIPRRSHATLHSYREDVFGCRLCSAQGHFAKDCPHAGKSHIPIAAELAVALNYTARQSLLRGDRLAATGQQWPPKRGVRPPPQS